MGKSKHSPISDNKEPSTKILRLETKPSPAKRQPSLRKCKTVVKKPPLNICDLPSEILEKIMGNINIWHHNRIRGTSKRMKDVNDIFVMHEFQKALKKYTIQDPKSEASAGLRIIKQATEVYLRSGFESTFCGCILPMLRSSYKDPFCPHISQIKKFLVHFYARVSELIGDTWSQRWRLLYMITLMKLVKAFDKSIISSTGMPLHWRIVVELKGPWLGTLWTSKGQPRNHFRNRCNLLVILAEMLMANISGRGFKHVWECPNEMYVFGNDTSNSNHVPITLFTFTVYGSKKICNLFRSCLEDEPENFQWPAKWPNDQFTVNLDIICKAAMKWGCSKSQHMEFGPFAETYYSEGEE
ncbi:hypothetical protein FF38_05439 [Lucilia cuprina]|uniref:F-box domain-containing protein n=1 Tax=Lucilia cuprina TaxID=7375 RepID=A0A0L0BXJ9_LUCCU|nr:hypothetical protein FF38_05439 [Lucilia cuprina]